MMSEPIQAEVVDEEATKPVPLIERRWVIICSMVFAALFLAFPLLWRSRQFSIAGKIFWTFLVLLETFLLCWLLWWAVSFLLNTLRQQGLL